MTLSLQHPSVKNAIEGDDHWWAQPDDGICAFCHKSKPVTFKDPETGKRICEDCDKKRSLENDSKDGWPSTVDMRVILPGLVRYNDLLNDRGERVTGDVLVTKEALDRMANSLEGKPIINWDHRKVSASEFTKGRFQGVITTPAVFNAADGWYHAKGLVWDEATRKNIENGYSISCAYTVSEWGEGPGTLNMVPYLQEVKNGKYTHIAVVPTPRYEGARIELLNSGGKTMGLLSLFRKDKPEEKIDIDMGAKVSLENGVEATLEEMANSWRKEQALKDAASGKFTDADIVEIDGKKVSLKELKNAHLAMYNEAEKRDREEKHNSGAHKGSPMSNCERCNAESEESKKQEEKERKEQEERTNSQAAAKKAKEAEELKNAEAKAKAEAEKKAAELENARSKGGKVEYPKITSLREMMAEGEARYGVKQPAEAAK